MKTNPINYAKELTKIQKPITKEEITQMTKDEKQELIKDLKSNLKKTDELTLSDNYYNDKKITEDYFKADSFTRAKMDFTRKTEAFSNLLTNMFGSQSNLYRVSKGDLFDIIDNKPLSDEAESAINENGDFSIKSVSKKIIDFAKSLANGDSDKIDILSKAIEDGFNAAEKSFGGENKLPKICYDTFDSVKNEIQIWKNENIKTNIPDTEIGLSNPIE